MHGPLFQNGSFEFIPIPDPKGQDERTYGNTVGRHGRLRIENNLFQVEFRVKDDGRRQVIPKNSPFAGGGKERHDLKLSRKSDRLFSDREHGWRQGPHAVS